MSKDKQILELQISTYEEDFAKEVAEKQRIQAARESSERNLAELQSQNASLREQVPQI